MAETCVELPDLCWDLIFSFLDHHQQLEAPSLVCKRFLSIANCLRLSLTVADPTVPFLSRLFRRFPQLKKIDLRDFHGDLNGLVHQIARSGLDLEELNVSNKRNLPLQSLSELGSNMKNLKVLKCSWLCLQDSDLSVIASSLPWLEELDISYPERDDDSMHEWGFLTPHKGTVTDAGIEALSTITEEGLAGILKKCREVRHLEVNRCDGMKNIGTDFGFCKLEVLRAQGLGINDEALAIIGKRCGGLLHFDLQGCLNVTVRGVKEVVQNCRGLREINLKYCDNVDVEIVAWMVFTRPSLRKITPPCGFAPSEGQKNLFLRHGCIVFDG
ncbi:hypothetical protein L1049_004459 [Liquidambar formosana]|uniref:Uncharacterized protein n=1 Tax=Liquidambar formosana TaxID=63359 RepID=A0AAP0RNH6_LIQFO